MSISSMPPLCDPPLSSGIPPCLCCHRLEMEKQDLEMEVEDLLEELSHAYNKSRVLHVKLCF